MNLVVAGAKRWVILWLLVVAVTGLVVILRGADALRVETNLMALLPGVDSNARVEQAKRVVASGVEQRLLMLVAADTPARAADAARELNQDLERSGLFRQVGLAPNDQSGPDLYQTLLPYRYQLLSNRSRQSLKTDPQLLVKEGLRALYSPAGFIRATSLERDPLYLFGGYLEQMAPAGTSVDQGIPLLVDGATHYAVITAELDRAAFDLDQQALLLTLIRKLEGEQVAVNRQLYVAGLPLYAASGAERAEREIRVVGLGSCLGIILLLVLSFGSPRPLLLALFAVATGVFGAWSISSLIFGQLHILTLVFGASLVGVAVDYCLHYFCACLPPAENKLTGTNGNNGEGTLQSVVRSMTLALITSVAAYMCLSATPFPGLRQIAVFSATGLVFAWLTVVALFPLLSRGISWPSRTALLNVASSIANRWADWLIRYRWLSATCLLAIIAGIGALHSEDDVRQLQAPDRVLQEQDRHIKAVMPEAMDSRFFVVSGATLTETLQREAYLTATLDRLATAGAINGYQSLSQYFPTATQQKSDYQLLEDALYSNNQMRSYLQALGFSDDAIDQEYREFAQAKDRQLTLTEWLPVVDERWRSLWLGCDASGCGAIVRLAGVQDTGQLNALKLPGGVYLVDTVYQTSALMAEYRGRATALLVLGMIVALLLLSWRRGWRAALAIILVPATAIAVTLGVLGWLGESLSLFRVFALLLVLGIGADFGIFAVQQRGLASHTALAIALSAATTLLAFGLLSLSDTDVVRSFGQTLLIGIASAFVLAPMAGRIKNR